MRIFEAIVNYADPPKKFWLVFDIPKTTEPNEWQATELEQISKGELRGLQGISSTREIITNWWMGARNAVLMMDGEAVIAMNDVEKINYDDFDYLCSDNMRPLMRIWAKSDGNHYGFMMNLINHIEPYLGGELQWMVSYYGMATKAADVWKEMVRPPVNSFYDAVEMIRMVLELAADKLKDGYVDHFKELLKATDDLYDPLRQALKHIRWVYSDEQEWLIRNPSFRIPKGSTLLIGIDKEIFGRVMRGGYEDTVDYKFHPYRFKAAEEMLHVLRKYRLASHYKIKLIDEVKYRQIVPNVRDRRSKN